MKKIIYVLGILLLIYLLYWRLRFGLTRYFDTDELAHLHWGHNFFSGRMPYTDFFYIFPPYFLFLLSGIWAIFGNTITVVTEARVMVFIFFLLLLAIVFIFGRMMRGVGSGLLAVLILLFIPIPYDKMVEVRPDLPATASAFLGMYLFILSISNIKYQISNKQIKNQIFLFLSGSAYGVSIGMVPKTVFFVPPVLFTFGFWYWRQKIHIAEATKSFAIWAVGLGLPLLGVLFFAVFSGNPLYALQLMTKVASDASLELVTIYNHSFYMFPAHFFWPSQAFYGEGGMNFQYYVNLVIWIGGSVFAIVRSVGFLAGNTFKKQLVTLFVAATFFINFFGFVYVFPLKHSQYLIPLVPFVCLFFADLCESLREYLEKRRKIYSLGFSFLLLTVILIVAEMTNRPKTSWTNVRDMEIFQEIESLVPSGSYVFDLSGYALKYKDPYYYCCVPYGQYWRVLPYKPQLSESLEKRETLYVVNTKLDTLPDNDRQYVEAIYTKPYLNGFVLAK